VRTPRIGWLAWSLWGLTMTLEVAAIWLWLGNRSQGRRRRLCAPAVCRPRLCGRIAGLQRGLWRPRPVACWYVAARRVPGGAARGLAMAGELPAALPDLAAVPDGRLPSPRWRPAARFLLVTWTLAFLLNALAPAAGNPLSVPALQQPGLRLLTAWVPPASLVAVVLSAAAPFFAFAAQATSNANSSNGSPSPSWRAS
jgi:hypothetical protein